MTSSSRRDVLLYGAVMIATTELAGPLAFAAEGAATTKELQVEIEPLLRELERHRQAWIEGRFAPAEGLVAQAPDMTIFGPFGGDAGPGGPDLEARQRRMSAMFKGGSGESELVRAHAAGDLLVLVMIERNQVSFEGRSEPHAWSLRTTQVFRKDGERWIRLHRHADPLIERRSLEDTLTLLDEPGDGP